MIAYKGFQKDLKCRGFQFQEYFAESVLEYTENPSVLKAQRPQTYEAITNALSKVTDAQVNKIMNVYKVIWK